MVPLLRKLQSNADTGTWNAVRTLRREEHCAVRSHKRGARDSSARGLDMRGEIPEKIEAIRTTAPRALHHPLLMFFTLT